MPELPEVEVVRRGLEQGVLGRTVSAAEVLHPRAVRRHVPGPVDLTRRLKGRTITGAHRRGKYLWLTLDDGEQALVAHLGMSGQLLLTPPNADVGPHLRVRLDFADAGSQLRFVDQRTFGWVALDEVVAGVPTSAAHIARDPLDPNFDLASVCADLRRRRSEVKRALLDQTLVSGIGNIYADEALWRVRLHYATPAASLSAARARSLIEAAAAVMTEALARGGTSFDRLYVDVEGHQGWFEQSLNAYGRESEPCRRCGRPLRREAWANRSSFRCPQCQRPPRTTNRPG
ncbi:MAG: bifunctional DNA-formamidopyrimidine glycosylase/DNA-(apurinic or apyrimidinic site) lyase [Actinomycetes bacterium]